MPDLDFKIIKNEGDDSGEKLALMENYLLKLIKNYDGTNLFGLKYVRENIGTISAFSTKI